MIPTRWSSAIAILRRRRLDAAEEPMLCRRGATERERADEGGTTAGEAPADSTLQQSAIELGRIHARIRQLLKQLTGG